MLADPLWVDAHVHVWQLARDHPIEIRKRIAALARDFSVEDLSAEAAPLSIRRCILVEAAATTAETDFLLDQQQLRPDLIAGVIGWVDLSSSEVDATLDRRCALPAFRGVREMAVFAERSDCLLSRGFQRGFEALAARGLCFELVTRPDQLNVAYEVATSNPDLKVNINHCGRPVVQCREWSPWAADMAKLARLGNATCKLSGLIERAGFEWTAGELKPYVSHLLDVFGSERLMFASNWPVMTLAGTYRRWWETVHEILDSVGAAGVDRNNIFRDSAARFYSLES